jgi:hypothetical protein
VLIRGRRNSVRVKSPTIAYACDQCLLRFQLTRDDWLEDIAGLGFAEGRAPNVQYLDRLPAIGTVEHACRKPLQGLARLATAVPVT